MDSALECPNCTALLDDTFVNRTDLAPCPRCAVGLQVEIFPSLFRPVAAGRAGEALVVETEASCFYHPQKKAVLPCEACGRFLCALCDCELHGQHFCPTCLETGRKKGGIKRLENERTLYDSVALSLAVYPLLLFFLFYFTIITAPLALYIALRHWNSPRSIVHRTKLRLLLAIIIAGLQIVGWGVGIYFLSARSRSHG